MYYVARRFFLVKSLNLDDINLECKFKKNRKFQMFRSLNVYIIEKFRIQV